MKKPSLILSIILSLSLNSKAQSDDLNEIFEWYDWLKKYCQDSVKYCDNQMCNKKIVELHKNGKIKSIIKYKNGKPEGLTKEYFKDGKLKEIGYLKNGKRDKKWKIYYNSGKIETIYEFIDSIGIFKDMSYPIKSTSYYEKGPIKGFYKLDKYLCLIEGYSLSPKGDTTSSEKIIDTKERIYLSTERFENGKIKTIGKRKLIGPFRSQEIGFWKTYNREGKLIEERKIN